MWKSSRSTFSTNFYCVIDIFLFQLNNKNLFREIYLDGNQLGCQGAFDLIKLLLLDCERFLIDKQDKLRAENELKAQEGYREEEKKNKRSILILNFV